MCEVNKTDAPDPVGGMKGMGYAEAELRQGKMRAAATAYETQCVAAPGLRDRVGNAFSRAASESRRVDRLRELADLLDTNPAVARILELIEETRV